MPDRPEVDSVELYAGPADGREVRLDPNGIDALVVAGGVYRRADDGRWRFDGKQSGPAIADDAVCDEAIVMFGEETLRRMLALVAVQEAFKGDHQFWGALAMRVNRKASEETQ